ncbi:MAG: GNAT family protein [Sphaerobacter sp.]|nr:GNAT family protein [Sphaerobacter sp.]
MRAVYLTGPTIYLRALQADDKDVAMAWHQSPFPIDATRAEQILNEVHSDPWDSREWLLAIARLADDAVVGSVRIYFWRDEASVRVHTAPWVTDADAVQAEALRLVLPWLRDERERLLIELNLPADQPATLAAAEEAGFTARARLREYFARPGHRVDLVVYQWVHPIVEAAHA